MMLLQVVIGIIFMLALICVIMVTTTICRKIFMPTHRKYTNRQRKV